MSDAKRDETGRNHLSPEDRHREYSVARDVQQEYPLPFGTDPPMAPVTPAVFSHYYGVESSSQLRDEMSEGEEYLHPEIGDLEEMRLYLGLRQDELADAIGVSRQTYYQWRMQLSSPSVESLGAAITALTDAWGDTRARGDLLDRDKTGGNDRSPARVAVLRHIGDLANIPNPARSDDVRLSEREMAFVYGALTGDYRTPLCAEGKGGVYRLVAAECGLDGAEIADRGRFKNNELLDVQAELMRYGAPSPRLDEMAREPASPRPHRGAMPTDTEARSPTRAASMSPRPSPEVREMLSQSRELGDGASESGSVDRVPENLEELFADIGLDGEVVLRARELYGEAAADAVQDGRGVAAVLAAAVVRAGREKSYGIPIRYAAGQMDAEPSVVMDSLRQLRSAADLDPIPVDPLDFLPFLTDRVTITPGSEQTAEKYLEELADAGGSGYNRDPVGMAAAAVYKATSEQYTQRELAVAAGLTEETIRVSLLALDDSIE